MGRQTRLVSSEMLHPTTQHTQHCGPWVARIAPLQAQETLFPSPPSRKTLYHLICARSATYVALLVMVRPQETRKVGPFGSGEVRLGFAPSPAPQRWDFDAVAMKKGKKLGAEASRDAAYFPVGEEARARFRHQSLLRDYEDLRKETEAKKKKMHKSNQKKLKLLAEVKFMRRRYKSLVQNQNQKPCSTPSSQLLITDQPCNASFRLLAKVQNQEIVEDMVEYQVSLELAKAHESTNSSVEGDDAMANDLKLSICRDVGEGSNQLVKRKIRWQDQVALRV